MPAALLVACLLASLSGCATAQGPPAGVTVRIFQNRFDYADRVLEVSVSNAGPTSLDLRSARFDSTRFIAAAVWTTRLRLEPGMTRDLRVHLAPTSCTDLTAPTDTVALDTVTLDWVGPSGSSGSATLPAVDDSGALDRIQDEDCLAEALTGVVSVAVSPELRVDGTGPASRAWLDLSLTPTGAPGTVTIDQVGATVLLASADGLDWPVGRTLDATTPTARLSLALRPTRCDPHAIAEDKRGTVFPLRVHVAVGPGAPQRSGDWDLAVDDALRARLYAWIADRCG